MSNLTVVLISCGEPTEEWCLNSLNVAQGFEIEYIRFVYPQIKALNQMIKVVNTEYFIELNADMILHSDWYERVIDKIENWPKDDKCYSTLFSLWDTLTQERILALKIFKTSFMKNDPFHDVPTPDVEHYQRMIAQNFYMDSKANQEVSIGRHIVTGNKCCYAKYKDVYKTFRTHQFEWDKGVFKGGKDIKSKANNHYNFFIGRYNNTGNPDYLWCIIGMIDGLTCDLDGTSKTYEFELEKITNLHKQAIERYENWYNKDETPKKASNRIFV